MTAIAYPSGVPIPRAVQWSLTPNTKVFSSPLSNVVQTVEYPGALWSCAFSFAPMLYAQAAVLEAWIISLVGRAGRASLYPFHRQAPRGSLSGGVAVNGGGQTGTTLVLKSAGAGTTLLAGDFFSVNGQLLQVTANATASGGGAITASFRPPLRQSPTDNTSIVYSRPTVVMMLTSDSNPTEYGIGNIAQVASLQFNEALDLGRVFAVDTPTGPASGSDVSILPGITV